MCNERFRMVVNTEFCVGANARAVCLRSCSDDKYKGLITIPYTKLLFLEKALKVVVNVAKTH